MKPGASAEAPSRGAVRAALPCGRRPASGAWLALLIAVVGCGGGGGPGEPTPEDPPTEVWRVVAEASFDIKGLCALPAGGVVAVGSNRILSFSAGTWRDERIEAGSSLAAVAAVADEAVAVGAGGIVLRGLPGAWRRLDAGATANLRAVAGKAAGAIVAVGELGTIVRWNGSGWANESVGAGATFLGVCLLSTGTAFAVTSEGDVWSDGSGAWVLLDLGLTGYVRQELTAVADLGGGSLVVVGDDERILFFDGATWTVERNGPSTVPFVAVAGDGAGPVAVTADRRVFARNSGVWSTTASLGSPELPTSLCRAADGKYFLAGRSATVATADPAATSWQVVHGYHDEDVVDALATGDGVTLVGSAGALWSRAGGIWTIRAPSPAATVTRVWSSDGVTVYAVGTYDQVTVVESAGWVPEPVGLGMTPLGIDGRLDGTLVLAGRDGRIATGGPGAWLAQSSGVATNLRDVRWLDAEMAVAVGDAGTAVGWNGTTWTIENTATTDDLLRLECSSPGLVYALGRAGPGAGAFRVHKRDADQWTVTGDDVQFGGAVITDIAADSQGCLHACSLAGGLYLLRNGHWYETARFPDYRLTTIAACADGSIVAGGADGVILTLP